MTARIRLVFAVAVVAASSVALAGGSLEESRWKDSHEKNLKSGADSANTKCGSSIGAKFDWDSIKFDDWGTLLGATGGNSEDYLIPTSVLQQVCMKADGKAAVQKEIKTIVIKAGTATGIALKDGELDFTVVLKGKVHYPTRHDTLDYVEKHL